VPLFFYLFDKLAEPEEEGNRARRRRRPPATAPHEERHDG